MPAFRLILQQRQERIEKVLQQSLHQSGLQQAQVPERLYRAMHYAVLGGGKRLRPQLAYAAAEAVAGAHTFADIPACAVELVHAYSLIHDDLPAMDDDVLRRGKPTCHIAFDEATAILAGDALQALAFELLATSPRLMTGHNVRLQMLAELSRASGWRGMVAGQALDIAAAGSALTEEELGRMHGLKTGALITASVLLGALSTNVATPAQLDKLREFATHTGLAFQIRDDILDVEASTAVSGKVQGKDASHNKPTYASLLGVQGATRRLQETADKAEQALADFGVGAQNLRELSRLMAARPS
jgi:geranylgeranyl pyrophosphate synthase